MRVSNRQRRILEVLLNRQGAEVTAGQLALEVRISARTVHRELQEIEPILGEYGMSLVKKSGIGISLDGGEQQLKRFQEQLRQSETETYSPEERKVLMLCRLLEEEEPVKLFTLAREVQAAIPTVSRDLDELEPQLVRSGLELVRRRGYGVEIAGPEASKRAFIVWMAEEYLDPSDWFGTPSAQTEQWPVTRTLLELVGQDTFLQIEQALWQQTQEWLAGLKESEFTRLMIRLSVAVSRIKRNHLLAAIHEPPPTARSSILQRLAESLGLELPPQESEFLQALFDESQQSAADVTPVILEKYGLELAEQTVALIRSVESRVDNALSKDRSLLDGLIRHLGPALERLRHGEGIRNPLLNQIRNDYEDLFTIVRQNAKENWPDLVIPDEEVGYLVMHFGAALERWKLSPANVKALLVCTSGIGSSKLLAARITRDIPQINLIGHYSWYEASHMPEDQYDLIISTVDLPLEPERYIKISPLLTREETEKLRARIRGIARPAPAHTSSAPQADSGSWSRLQLMSVYASAMVSLLDTFKVYSIDNGTGDADAKRLLASMLGKLSAADALIHEERIVTQLIEREKQGSLLIPETGLALYHTRSEWVRKPTLSVFRLATPIRTSSDPDTDVKQILLMLAPKAIGRQALEVLSEISAMLLIPEFVRLLETEEDEHAIRAFLSRNLEIYIRDILEWRDAR